MNPHIPVLMNEVIELLSPVKNGLYIDGTVGFGGHAYELLQTHKTLKLLGIDRDLDAINFTNNRLKEFDDRICLTHGNYGSMTDYANSLGWDSVDGIILDLGISSFQIDQADRGFSFDQNGPLDMRMNRSERMTASNLVNTLSIKKLENVLREFGEEPKAKKLAAAIVNARQQRPWSKTLELANFIKKISHEPQNRYSKTVARCFQALRIAINQELSQLKSGLDAAMNLLKKRGRLVVISFHSLEDRIVKEKFNYEALQCTCPPDFPVCRCSKTANLRVLTKKPKTATTEELNHNKRSSSAKLRAAERL